MSTSVNLLNKAANNIRILSAAMVETANSGHPGGSMGCADFINVLYSEFLIFDPKNPYWKGRDRYFQDPGHMSPMLYSVLSLAGFISVSELKHFRELNSTIHGHPELNIQQGIENTSGPLGQGHAYAVGAAIAAKFLKSRFGEAMNQTIYTLISDGGIQEEISQGAGRIAGDLGLDNLVMYYDANGIQLSTRTEDVTRENVAMKYEAWGWRVIKIDGNNPTEIRAALTEAKLENKKPTLIIGTTQMAKGTVNKEGENLGNLIATHGQPLSAAGADFDQTIRNLGGDPKNPFTVFEDVKQLYELRKIELSKIVAEKKQKEDLWASENKKLSEELNQWFDKNYTPNIDWSSIEQKPNQATRAGSGTVLAHLSKYVPNMIVASADLSNSDKTDGFLKNTKPINKDDFSGNFLQTGVSELTMAALMVGMTLHGGVITACGTFFVFSDYMKPVIRMAALMELPVKFIWTHDSFRVGEDGPTHQPVEQEAQIKLMEQLQNHHGENSMLVIRPADVNETTVAWKMALENTKTPTGIILSRQNIVDLPTDGENKYLSALRSEKGAYIVSGEHNFDIILLASGSEVSTLVQGAELLAKDGIKCRIVSVPSEGLFLKQSKAYQESVLPKGNKIFGLTAGLSIGLLRLVGDINNIWGLNSFGLSAPYNVLDNKFGFTPENVYAQVKNILKEVNNKISKTDKPIGLASDHAGYEMKEMIKQMLEKSNIDYIDFGAHSTKSVDYPDYGHKLGKAISDGDLEFGIALCGSGNGINMTINKHQNVRGALCWTAEISALAREHNDANILTIPARFVSVEECKKIVKAFFQTEFLHGRHQDRTCKINI